jgi:acyl-CoA thioesterase-2
MDLAGLFDLAPDGDDVFVAPTTSSPWPRLFGGLVAAQSLAAACRTVPSHHRPQSLHAYFILGGVPTEPLRLTVERTRDGRSFTTRRVVASQGAGAVFEMSASFHDDSKEEEDEWSSLPYIDAADPDSLPASSTADDRPSRFFDIRPLEPLDLPYVPLPYWVRVAQPLPDDEFLAACVLAYISDMGILGTARPPGLGPFATASSLDHAIWFHRPFRPGDWHLYAGSPRSSRRGRGLAVGGLRTRDGDLVATVVQEGIFRPAR